MYHNVIVGIGCAGHLQWQSQRLRLYVGSMKRISRVCSPGSVPNISLKLLSRELRATPRKYIFQVISSFTLVNDAWCFRFEIAEAAHFTQLRFIPVWETQRQRDDARSLRPCVPPSGSRAEPRASCRIAAIRL